MMDLFGSALKAVEEQLASRLDKRVGRPRESDRRIYFVGEFILTDEGLYMVRGDERKPLLKQSTAHFLMLFLFVDKSFDEAEVVTKLDREMARAWANVEDMALTIVAREPDASFNTMLAELRGLIQSSLPHSDTRWAPYRSLIDPDLE